MIDKVKIHIIKIGGQIIDREENLTLFIEQISQIKEPFILVHGGGKIASEISKKLGIQPRLVEGRRLTDSETLQIVIMVYAGLINKKIVALLQANQINAIGLSGADANTIPASKRIQPDIDFGFVGDIEKELINSSFLTDIIKKGYSPVFCPITHDGKGQLLNTNADTIASALARKLAHEFDVYLHFCFEKPGVLIDVNDEHSLIKEINKEKFIELKKQGILSDGIIPKIENALDAIESGVRQVSILQAENLNFFIKGINQNGTKIIS